MLAQLAVAAAAGSGDPLSWILDLVQSVDPVLRILLSAVAIFCETSILIGLIVPGDSIVLVSGTATGNTVEYLALLVAVIVGSLGGESVGFLLGRLFGPRLRHSRLGRRVGERNWMRAERYLERRGGPAVFLSRFLPVLHSLVPVTVGMSEMTYRRFLSWTAPACVLWAGAYVTVGWLAAGSYRQLSAQLHWAGYLFVGVIVVFVIAVAVIKKLIERAERRHLGD
ncbi:DedA family protein [Schumannella sp. 10F1B-5-1]|uniref:DedA family protein n=1 Tax=Schumannella sp. 10F1B-5-1 TaxID=2590780 RepID=UPI0011315EFA|nr:DedA family protein [Schumannella sp. 10F1B-5-1]TPW70199.1 DedA family protein [Schumannella sp. 10F1B-5-1]